MKQSSVNSKQRGAHRNGLVLVASYTVLAHVKAANLVQEQSCVYTNWCCGGTAYLGLGFVVSDSTSLRPQYSVLRALALQLQLPVCIREPHICNTLRSNVRKQLGIMTVYRAPPLGIFWSQNKSTPRAHASAKDSIDKGTEEGTHIRHCNCTVLYCAEQSGYCVRENFPRASGRQGRLIKTP